MRTIARRPIDRLSSFIIDMKKFLFLAATLFTPMLAHAGCEDHLQAWMSELHPGRKVAPEHAVCEVWSANPHLTLAALPLSQGNDRRFDLDIVLADTASGKILTHRYQEGALDFGQSHFLDIAFDTSLSKLTPDQNTFGLRVSSSHVSNEQPKGATTLSLYVIDDHGLRPVLNGFAVALAQGRWDGKCVGYFDATSRSIEPGERGKDGFAVLKVSETSARTVSQKSKGQCVSREGRQTRKTFTMNYQNGVYDVPPLTGRG
jgi:hypothetical protein